MKPLLVEITVFFTFTYKVVFFEFYRCYFPSLKWLFEYRVACLDLSDQSNPLNLLARDSIMLVKLHSSFYLKNKHHY